MVKKNPPRPRDMNQLAKRIVDISTGQYTEKEPITTPKPTKKRKPKS